MCKCKMRVDVVVELGQVDTVGFEPDLDKSEFEDERSKCVWMWLMKLTAAVVVVVVVRVLLVDGGGQEAGKRSQFSPHDD